MKIKIRRSVCASCVRVHIKSVSVEVTTAVAGGLVTASERAEN